MRELVVQVANPSWLDEQTAFLRSRRLGDISASPAPVAHEPRAWSDVLAQLGPDSHVFRLELGNAFCPYLHWRRAEYDRTIATARDCGFEVTVTLGVLHEQEQARRLAELDALLERHGRLEVAANDWGTLRALGGRDAEPVAGRLLFRMKRLPRVSRDTRPVLPGPENPSLQAEVLKRQLGELAEFPADTAWMRALLARLGVQRTEAELVPQGIRLAGDGWPVSLHVPWTYITGGGRCPVAKLTTRAGRTTCARACRTTFIQARYPTRTWPLVQVGHTVFSPMSGLLQAYLDQARYDRLVVSPGVPM